MKPISTAAMVLTLLAVSSCTAYGQAPVYDTSSGSPQYNGYDRGYNVAPTPRDEVGFFYDDLSPYGDWVRTPDYGWAWFPRDVSPYWRPYTDGRWVNTAYGWTWVSREPYGWATYHYGRWTQYPHFGWLWIPGTIWGPAWVSWQYGGGYVGWAPLPPSVGFEINVGIRLGGFTLSSSIRPDAYCFVPERSFLQPRLSRHLISAARNVTIIHHTTNITNYTYIDNRVVNRGIDLRRIEQVTGRRVQPFRVTEGRADVRTVVTGNQVRMYRPGRQQLDSVRIGPRANAGLRVEAAPAGGQQGQPRGDRRDAPAFQVAPRVDRAPHPDARQIEQRNRREQQQLAQYLAKQRQKLEKLHQQELVKARAQADRNLVERRHRAELEAMQQEQRNAAQQLQARQQTARRAALAKSAVRPAPRGTNKAVDPKQEKKKGKKQSRHQKR